jgi:hypothetical protein
LRGRSRHTVTRQAAITTDAAIMNGHGGEDVVSRNKKLLHGLEAE